VSFNSRMKRFKTLKFMREIILFRRGYSQKFIDSQGRDKGGNEVMRLSVECQKLRNNSCMDKYIFHEFSGKFSRGNKENMLVEVLNDSF
jgi:hypothetical protein